MWFDALPENCFFYVFSLYEFLHSLEPKQTKDRVTSHDGGGTHLFLSRPGSEPYGHHDSADLRLALNPTLARKPGRPCDSW